MSIFDFFSTNKPENNSIRAGFIDGPNKNDDSHDHRYNKGNDRTPAQKTGDKSRRNDSEGKDYIY